MKFRSFKLRGIETREKKDTGFISALVSESGVYEPDFGTTFIEGAWRRTIDASGGKFPLLWMHSITSPVGIGPFSETKRGLILEDGEVDLTIPDGRIVYSGAQRGYIDTMSQGFETLSYDLDPDKDHSTPWGEPGQLINEVKLYEASFVTRGFAGNPGAAIEAVRATTVGIERVNDALRKGSEEMLEKALVELRALLKVPEATNAPPWYVEALGGIRGIKALLKDDGSPDGTLMDEDSLLNELRGYSHQINKTLQQTR